MYGNTIRSRLHLSAHSAGNGHQGVHFNALFEHHRQQSAKPKEIRVELNTRGENLADLLGVEEFVVSGERR